MSVTFVIHASKDVVCLHKHVPSKKERKWKWGQMTQEEYRDTFWASRDKARKAKFHMELDLVREVKDNKKSFYKYNSCKRKTKKYWTRC